MLFCFTLLTVSLVACLHGSRVSACDVNCADIPVFTPSELVVKYGDSASANCSVCRNCQTSSFDIETPVGVLTRNETTRSVSWTIDRLTEWGINPMCYYTDDASNYQCCSFLPVTLYKPPDNVSISFAGHNGTMYEGHQYTLQCEVQDVAPVGKLTVTFYRGQTVLARLQSKNTGERKPVTETFTVNITASKEDDGGHYWCEAKLELGPEGPQPPPVVKSPKTPAATVLYKPQFELPSSSRTTIITEGDRLELDCSAVGNPSPSYTWTVPGQSSSNSSILIIDSIAYVNKGQFICLVWNHMGNVTKTFDVDVQDVNCADIPVFTPSELVVKYGDSASASCSVCRNCQTSSFDIETPVGVLTRNETTRSVSWRVDGLTEWGINPMCYYTDAVSGRQCCSFLPVTLYKPPDNVSISFAGSMRPMYEGHQYTLQCEVQDVAPVGKLNVTFYRGQTVLDRLQSKNTGEKKPVTETFTVNITASKEDDGGHYWCEAKLELGPEGPQPPPVVKSPKTLTIIHYSNTVSTGHPFLVLAVAVVVVGVIIIYFIRFICLRLKSII